MKSFQLTLVCLLMGCSFLNTNAQETTNLDKDSLRTEILEILNDANCGYMYHTPGKEINSKKINKTKIISTVRIEDDSLIFDLEKIGVKKISLIDYVNMVNFNYGSIGFFDLNWGMEAPIDFFIDAYSFEYNKKTINSDSDRAKKESKRLYDLLVEYKKIHETLVQEQELEAFKLTVQACHESADKQTFSEEQREYVVQANAYNDKQEYKNAILYYEKSMAINPCSFPEGYYNMALIAAQIKSYRLAILNMKKYLTLVPEARDARAAKDKIYEWKINIK